MTEPMTMVRMEITRHHPSEGVLCWGGPQHGEVVVAPELRDEWRFAISRRPSVNFDFEEPVGMAFQTVSYYRREFAVRWNEGDGETWPVLVYGDGRERLTMNLETTVQFLMWLCHPFMPVAGGQDGAS